MGTKKQIFYEEIFKTSEALIKEAYPISFVGVPVNQNGDIVTQSNIIQTEGLIIRVKKWQIDSIKAMFFVVFGDAGGKTIYVQTYKKTIKNYDEIIYIELDEQIEWAYNMKVAVFAEYPVFKQPAPTQDFLLQDI